MDVRGPRQPKAWSTGSTRHFSCSPPRRTCEHGAHAARSPHALGLVRCLQAPSMVSSFKPPKRKNPKVCSFSRQWSYDQHMDRGGRSQSLGADAIETNDRLASIYRELAPAVLGYLRGSGAAEPEDLLGDVF